jgi:hypothetical protein
MWDFDKIIPAFIPWHSYPGIHTLALILGTLIPGVIYRLAVIDLVLIPGVTLCVFF